MHNVHKVQSCRTCIFLLLSHVLYVHVHVIHKAKNDKTYVTCTCIFGYDLKIGTSERGDKSVEDKSFRIPAYEHALIVFGGVAGIEECVDADESIKLPGSQSKKLFDVW